MRDDRFAVRRCPEGILIEVDGATVEHLQDALRVLLELAVDLRNRAGDIELERKRAATIVQDDRRRERRREVAEILDRFDALRSALGDAHAARKALARERHEPEYLVGFALRDARRERRRHEVPEPQVQEEAAARDEKNRRQRQRGGTPPPVPRLRDPGQHDRAVHGRHRVRTDEVAECH